MNNDNVIKELAYMDDKLDRIIEQNRLIMNSLIIMNSLMRAKGGRKNDASKNN